MRYDLFVGGYRENIEIHHTHTQHIIQHTQHRHRHYIALHITQSRRVVFESSNEIWILYGLESGSATTYAVCRTESETETETETEDRCDFSSWAHQTLQISNKLPVSNQWNFIRPFHLFTSKLIAQIQSNRINILFWQPKRHSALHLINSLQLQCMRALSLSLKCYATEWLLFFSSSLSMIYLALQWSALLDCDASSNGTHRHCNCNWIINEFCCCFGSFCRRNCTFMQNLIYYLLI